MRMKIGAIDLSPPFALAPMAGMTDTAFRRLVKRKGGCLRQVGFRMGVAMKNAVLSAFFHVQHELNCDPRPARPAGMGWVGRVADTVAGVGFR